jgi:hypothetical protein
MQIDRLKELLFYCPISGDFVWLKNGSIAGCAYENGYGNVYRRIGIDGKYYMAHRLAWLYVYGSLPVDDIDHIDHNGINNRIGNLRIATDEINQKNAKLHRKNKSGISGVCFVAKSGKWHASISAQKKQRHIGSFSDFFEACCARKSSELRNLYHSNHGLIT